MEEVIKKFLLCMYNSGLIELKTKDEKYRLDGSIESCKIENYLEILKKFEKSDKFFYNKIEKCLIIHETNLNASNDFYLLFKEKNILCYDNLFEIEDFDLFYALCNRLNDRNKEDTILPLIHYNEIPLNYQLFKTLSIKLPILKQIELNSKIIDIPFYDTETKLPSKEYYFTASHRTLFSSKSSFYVKIDIPYRITNKYRNLTRNKNRIDASKIAIDELKLSKFDFEFRILDDIDYGDSNGFHYVIRNKYNDYKMIPLFTLYSKLNDESMLDYLMKSLSKKDKYDYLYNKILIPIIEVFGFFVNLSIKYNKVVLPYNFHNQNINLLYDDSIIGIAVQDLDMTKELTIRNILEEFDTFLSSIVVLPILEYAFQNIGEIEGVQMLTCLKKIIMKKIIIPLEDYFDRKMPQEYYRPAFFEHYTSIYPKGNNLKPFLRNDK